MLERLSAEGQLAAYRHEGFWQCMDTLRDVRYLRCALGPARPPLGDLGVTEPAAGSGAAGRSWSRAQRVSSAVGRPRIPCGGRVRSTGSTSTGIDRDRPTLQRVSPSVDGDVRDMALMERVLEDTERGHRHPPRRADAGRAGAGEIPSRRSSTTSWGPGPCWRHVAGAPTVRRIVVASSDKAYGDAGGRPYHEEMALPAVHPYDASKAAADILAQTYAHSVRPPGRHQPLRQPLRGRGPQVEPDRPRHDPVRAVR